MFYFATESGDHVIKILICDWSVINVVVFVCWSCKFCLYFRLLKLFNLFSLFNLSWTDSEMESLITFYSSMLVSGARNFATGVKNRRQKPTPVFCRRFLERVSLALELKRDRENSVINKSEVMIAALVWTAPLCQTVFINHESCSVC